MYQLYAGVYILDIPYHADKIYDYYVPLTMRSSVKVGMIAAVPYGKNNRHASAVIAEIKSESEYCDLKPIFDCDGDVILDEIALKLCRFLKEYTFCTFGEAVRAVTPAFAIGKLNEYYSLADTSQRDKCLKMNETAIAVYDYLKYHGRETRAKIISEFPDCSGILLKKMTAEGLLICDSEINSHTAGIVERYYTSAMPEKELSAVIEGSHASVKLRSEKQRELLKAVQSGVRLSEDELLACVSGASRAQLLALIKKGVLATECERSYRNPYAVTGDSGAPRIGNNEFALSNEQRSAYSSLVELYNTGEAKAALLHGVTGSGKTKVIMAMTDRVLSSGRGVIVLVPEIALTPQTVNEFASCYGSRLAVIHSGLSAGERFDAWHRIRIGEADLVIGTRSAIFAPLKNIGMIVIDEEQEHTYKSDSDPKYSAHDVARFLCGEHKALMLLSSATPSLLSYHKASSGSYKLIELKERYGAAHLPDVIVADMARENRLGNTTPYSHDLLKRLKATLDAKQQAVILLNRRGYNNFVTCRSCSEAVMCPNCSVSMTYHTKKPLSSAPDGEYLASRIDAGELICHYCGFTMKVPTKCPSCESEHFLFRGYGTQRAEEELKRIFPTARILRMDMDTTRKKFSHNSLIEKFRKGEADILLGTQMVAKGHDFPRVTLVGVLSADSSLYLDDYRASERTFSMLTQVIGRAGRAEDHGTAVIQAFETENEIISIAADQDYKSFYEKELPLRRQMSFPPFCDLAVITMSSADEGLLRLAAEKLPLELKEAVKRYPKVKLIAYGPFESPIYRVNNSFRMRMVIKCRFDREARAMLDSLMCSYGKNVGKRVTVSIDINPNSL